MGEASRQDLIHYLVGCCRFALAITKFLVRFVDFGSQLCPPLVHESALQDVEEHFLVAARQAFYGFEDVCKLRLHTTL